ncbi:MAG TPA: hypothetical protein VK463_16355 [Desulfomonilaceae bacterium]|nr:hypothetical protein [Desulfomonilaceae bacterium]
MRVILVHLICLVCLYSGLHGLTHVVSLAVVPQHKNLDTLHSKATIFYGPNKMVAAGIADLGHSMRPKMIFLGASNVLSGFRPTDLETLFPQYEIHNLALGNHNITRFLLEYGVIQRTLKKELLEKSVIVMGIWYGAFTENDGPNKKPLLNVEKIFLDSGLYVRRDGTIGPLFPPEWMPFIVGVLRPYYFAEYLVEVAQFKNRDFGLNFVQHDVADELIRPKMIDYFNTWIGRTDGKLAEEQFQELVALRELVDQSSGDLVIVDLPLPLWHSERSDYYKDYQNRKEKYLTSVTGSPRIRYINLQEDPNLTKAEAYYDGTHPNPSGALLWSKALRQSWKSY